MGERDEQHGAVMDLDMRRDILFLKILLPLFRFGFLSSVLGIS